MTLPLGYTLLEESVAGHFSNNRFLSVRLYLLYGGEVQQYSFSRPKMKCGHFVKRSKVRFLYCGKIEIYWYLQLIAQNYP